MRRTLFGVDLRRAAPVGSTAIAENRGGWFSLIREPFAGAWQRNQEWTADSVLAHHAVFACITLIASDIGKLHPKVVKKDGDGIWDDVKGKSAAADVLRRPNRYQNHIQFKEWWMMSKLLRGNAYALKYRTRGDVTALYLLDPSRVKVLVAPDGGVYYELQRDNLSSITEPVITVPASEIIHDRMNCLFHPLVGVSPIYAGGSSANIGLKIQANSANFFGNGSNPSGVLTAPGTIDQATAERLSERWNQMFSGENSGRVAVLGNDLKFEPMRMNATDSQTIEQLKWSAETVCATFHVPPFKVGIGSIPTYQNAELMNQIYYTDCLQAHIESFEAVMDAGLDLDGVTIGVELDLDGLLRMDSATQVKTLAEAVKGSIMAPNEARRRINLRPLDGGDSIYMQQQNYSLEALAQRDSENPLGKPDPAPPPPPPAAGDGDPDSQEPPPTDDPTKSLATFALKFITGLRSAA